MFPIGHQAHHIRKMSSREMRSILPAVAEQLFRDIQKIYLESSHSKESVHTGENIRGGMYRSIIARR